MKTSYDVIVVGGGPAGYTAALYAARANLSVLVLEKLTPGGQMGITPQIDNYPGFPDGVDGFTLAMNMKQQAERFGAETKMDGVTALHLTETPKRICTAKEEYTAGAVILALGASPRPLGLENEQALRGHGVSYCATCDGMFYRKKTAVIVGGGNTAVADALYLSRICERVILIHRRDTLRASAVYTEPLKAAENIEFLWNSEAVALLGEEKLSGVRVRNKLTGEEQDVPCNGLFVAIGSQPESELLNGQVTLTESGYVKADETTCTNLPGVYAVGDLRDKPLRQIVTAVADGAVAAQQAEQYLQSIK